MWYNVVEEVKVEQEKLEEMRKIIKLILLKIGIRCDLIGFAYLAYAIELVIFDPSLIHNLCNKLYVKVGRAFNIEKTNRVERSIRHAISNTGDKSGFAELNNIFKIKLYSIEQKPTAGELIKLIADYYTMGLYTKDNLLRNYSLT